MTRGRSALRSWLTRWLIVSGIVGGMLTAFLCICLAGFGLIRPEPTLGIIGFAGGTITWLGATWRLARRFRG